MGEGILGFFVNNPSYFKNCGDNCPVEQVSWDDVQVFLQKLNSKEGGSKYRLPTEAEWEYAARAGGSTGSPPTKYYWGNSIDDSYLWYAGNSGSKTHPVGQKKPNGFGLYDMSGNVWEWTQDWNDDNYYSKSPSNDPKGPESGTYRVLRGGSWYFYARFTRSSLRYNNTPDYRNFLIGFRLLKTD
ncbi:MAG: formylglycine-generating enzyme family protein [Leptospiraceae bacterium]|nr:formylglycine-generating enzyme family protein [Leptospiraceae bacterium]